MIKAIFFDIDGTLISFKTRKMSEITRQSLQQLQAKGIKIFISTGRGISDVEDIYPFDGYIVMNGQMVVINDKVIYKSVIPQNDIEIIYDELEKRDVTGIFMSDYLLMNRYTHYLYSLNYLGFHELPLSKKEELLNKDIYQMTILYPYKDIHDIIGRTSSVTASSWNDHLADIMTKGNNKATGIKKAIEYLNISQKDTMSFGDGGNDIDMLDYTHIGVAMGNANDEVKKHADFITLDCEDEGVTYALKHFQLI